MSERIFLSSLNDLVKHLELLGVTMSNKDGLNALLGLTGTLPSPGGGSTVAGKYAASATRQYPASTSFTYETAVTSAPSYAAVCVVRAETGYADSGPTAAPIVIKGRNFRNDTPTGNCAHVYLPSGRQVIFEDCTFASKSQNDLINVTDNTSVRVVNCRFYGDGTQLIGVTRGRALYSYKARRIEFEHNYGQNVAGNKYEYWSDNATAADNLLFRYNRFDDICGGTGGDYRQVLQVQHVQRAGTEIAWNQSRNRPGFSRVEDNYNIGESGGTAASPLRLHHNLIWGAYQANPTDGGYTGTGFTNDAGGAGVPAAQQPQYILAENNRIMGCQNAAMNIAAGHHNRYINNKIIISGYMPDDVTKLQGFYNAVSIFRGQPYDASQFDYNEISGNDIFTNTGNGKGPFYQNSLDPNVGDYRQYVGPNSKALLAGNTLNTYRDGARYADEVNGFLAWQGELEDAKIEVGVPA